MSGREIEGEGRWFREGDGDGEEDRMRMEVEGQRKGGIYMEGEEGEV